MKPKNQNLKGLQTQQELQATQAPVPTSAQVAKKLNRPSQELSVVLYVKTVCEKAMQDINSDNSKFKLKLADGVLLSSLKLLLLCNDINKSFCPKERQKLRCQLALELKLLCILVSLAFSIEFLGFKEISKQYTKVKPIAFKNHNIKAKIINLFKLLFYESLNIFKIQIFKTGKIIYEKV